jgi:hypothetical protein
VTNPALSKMKRDQLRLVQNQRLVWAAMIAGGTCWVTVMRFAPLRAR